MPRTHQSHGWHLEEPSSPEVLCSGERRPDLSQPGPGDLSPLTQVGVGHQIPPVSSKGLGVKETPMPGKVCVFWSHGCTPLPPHPRPMRRCPSRASVFSPGSALAPGTQQVFSNARPIVIKGALWSVSVSRYLGSPRGILSTSLGHPELGEGLTPHPCTLPAFPDPGWFVCPPPYCSLLTDHAQKGSG